jgi:hypothetical protein
LASTRVAAIAPASSTTVVLVWVYGPAARAAVTVTRWTSSVRRTCMPRAGPCARSVPSWASRRPRSAITYAVPGSRCVAAGPTYPASTQQILELRDRGLTWSQVAKQAGMTVRVPWRPLPEVPTPEAATPGRLAAGARRRPRPNPCRGVRAALADHLGRAPPELNSLQLDEPRTI